MIRQAFVLGAGLGTRLKALTHHRVKPLIPVANRPLITYAFDHLLGAGVQKFIVNTHWRAGDYAEAFPEARYRGADLQFRQEAPVILETGGGLKNAADLLGDQPFWVYNGDIFSTLPLERALEVHRQAGNEVTLVLRSKDGPLQVAWDNGSGRVIDIGGRLGSPGQFLFTGIYLVEPEFLARIPIAEPISVVPIFCDMIRQGARLGGVVIDEGHWFDLGTRDQYLAVHRFLASKIGGAPWIHPLAQIAPDARITGASSIGPRAQVKRGARVHDSVLWSDALVAEDSDLDECIVVSGSCATGKYHQADIVPASPTHLSP